MFTYDYKFMSIKILWPVSIFYIIYANVYYTIYFSSYDILIIAKNMKIGTFMGLGSIIA